MKETSGQAYLYFKKGVNNLSASVFRNKKIERQLFRNEWSDLPVRSKINLLDLSEF